MVFESSDVDWGLKSAYEIEEIGEKVGSIAILPVGSIEQHGRHLPVATDTIIVDSFARMVAERVQDDIPILKTPVVWSGHSPHHTSLGGTFSLKGNKLHNLLEELSNDVLDNGFDVLVLLNGHGGNASIISTVTSTIGSKHLDSQILSLNYFDFARLFTDSFINEIRDSDIGGIFHAGEFETSIMMHLRPELVKQKKIEANNLEPVNDYTIKDLFEPGLVSVYQEFEEYSPTGAIGSPELATAEKGEKIFDRLGEKMETFLKKIYNDNI